MNNEKSEGWISLHRSMMSHWLWEEDRIFSKAEAWIDLLMLANHAPGEFVHKFKVFKCERGQLLRSMDKLRKRWGWSKSTTSRFLRTLSEQGMIELKNETVLTRITIVKYEHYQNSRNANDTQRGSNGGANETQRGTYNKNNNNNNENTPPHTPPERGSFDGGGSGAEVELLQNVRNLKTAWNRPGKWTPRERGLLDQETIESMTEASAEDWRLLGRFMAYRPREGENYLQPDCRWFLVQNFDDVMADAYRWNEKHGKPRAKNPEDTIWK